MLNGIFSDLIRGEITNENTYYTSVTEAEVMEEMEKLDHVTSSVKLPDDPYDACYESMLINQQNYYNVLLSIANEEMEYYYNTGRELVYEGARLDAFFEKLKQLIDKAWVKIKDIYEKVLKTIHSWVLTDNQLVKKYKNVIEDSPAEARKIRGSYKVDARTIGSKYFYEKIVSAVSKNLNASNFGRKGYVTDKTTDEVKKQIRKELNDNLESEFYKDIFNKDYKSKEDITIMLQDYYGTRTMADTFELTGKEIVEELKDGNVTKKEIQAAYKSAKSSVSNFKAEVERAKRDTQKDTKTSISDDNLKYSFSQSTKICNYALSLLSLLQREQIKAANIYHKNCRKAANRAIRGNYAEESASLYYENAEFSFIR